MPFTHPLPIVPLSGQSTEKSWLKEKINRNATKIVVISSLWKCVVIRRFHQRKRLESAVKKYIMIAVACYDEPILKIKTVQANVGKKRRPQGCNRNL